MEWWTHLWLNEGFATWIEYLCVDHTHPEYEIWTNFLSREYASAMSLDALASSHPIEVGEGVVVVVVVVVVYVCVCYESRRPHQQPPH